MRFFATLRTIVVVGLVVPVVALAAQVGFVPSNGVWFSRTDVKPGEMIWAYTVVVNNNYHALNGTVVFYDNDQVIDTVVVEQLKKDEVRQLRAFWEPSVGEHRISVQFTKAEAVDEVGKKTVVTVAQSDNAATLVVQQKNDQLLLVPEAVAGEKLAVTTSSPPKTVSTTAVVATSSSAATTSFDIMAEGTALINKAQNFAGTLTSTAHKVEQTYTEVKQWIATGGSWYEQFMKQVQKFEPFMGAAYEAWLVVTNNNEPLRLGVIAVILVLAWWLVRRMYRRKRFYDDL